jgi:hypothetical protein
VPDQDDNGTLYDTVAPGTSTGVLSAPQESIPVGIGNEDLSLWAGYSTFGNVLFSLTEHAGQRMVYAIPTNDID